MGLRGLAAIGLGWAALWLSGRPGPHVDDLFFTGAAINLAGHHGLENPWFSAWMTQFGTRQFYVQPPLHPFLLAVWLRLTGVSTASILAYTDLAGAIVCAGIFLLLPRAGGRRWLALFAAAIGAQFVLQHGLRHDADSLACIALAALCWQRTGYPWWFAGCLFGALAPAFSPIMATMILPLGVWRMLKPGTGERNDRKILLALGATACGLVLLVGTIHGDFRLFWRVFHETARQRTSPPGRHFHDFFEELTLGREWLFRGSAFLLLAAAAGAAWRADHRPQVLAILAAFLGFLALGIWLYAGNMAQYGYLVAFLLTPWLIAQPGMPLRSSRFFIGAWVAIGGLNLAPDVVSACLQQSGSRAEYVHLHSAVAALGPKRLLIDEFAVRYVYDFRPPPNTLDWTLNRGALTMETNLRDKPPGDAWLVNSIKLDRYVPDSGVRAERMRILGHVFSTHLARPGDLRLLP